MLLRREFGLKAMQAVNKGAGFASTMLQMIGLPIPPLQIPPQVRKNGFCVSVLHVSTQYAEEYQC